MLAAITSGLTTVISWIGSVLTALVGESGALAELLPVMAIGIAISVFSFALSGIRRVCWGA